jgi:protein phosphatase
MKTKKARRRKDLSVGSRTDVGRIRAHNEDSLLVAPPLYVIADGMGGHAAGEVASELAVHTLENARITDTAPEALKDAVTEANSAIIKSAREGIGKVGMGTTLTAAVIVEDRLLIAQVGDSRAYLLQDGQLRRLTRDHSFVEDLVCAGKITAEEARVHPSRSVITRALGSDPVVQPDLYEVRVCASDRLLLCSDGLNSMLDAPTLRELLLENPDPQSAADALVEAANEAGGHDNVTVIVVDIDEVSLGAAPRQKRRFIWGVAVFLLIFVLLIVGTVGAVYAYARNAAFLIDEGGYVTLYRGLPGDLMGIELKWRDDDQASIPVSSLNPTTASELKTGIPTESIDEARQLMEQYEAQYKEQLKKR